MGKMELLKSGFTGKVGNVYGSKGNGKINAKAVPFSHTPHNEKQKNAFSAFGCLQRFSGFISKSIVFDELNLNYKNMLKINAVCKWLKPIIKDGVFDINKLEEIIKTSTKYETVVATFEKKAQVFKIAFLNESARDVSENSRTIMLITNTSGICFVGDVTVNDYFSRTYSTKAVEIGTAYIVVFEVYEKNKKTLYRDLTIKSITEA